MKKNAKYKKHFIVFVFLIVFSISILIVCGFLTKQKQLSIEHGSYILSSETTKLQYSIDSRVLKLQILEMIIVANPNSVDQFDEIAAELYEDDPSIRSLQLAPNGVVSYVYPLEGNENAFDDLFNDPNRRKEAEYARDTGNMTIAGPFELYQGGIGVVVRRPIYLTDTDGSQNFWGFSIAVLDVPEIFDKAKLSDLEADGYLYQIWKYHQNDDGIIEKKYIAGSEMALPADAITNVIQVPGDMWYFTIIPQKGWISHAQILFLVGTALLIDLLFTLVIYYLARTIKQKQELDTLANTDPLTGLYNARYLSAVLKDMVQQKQQFVLFFLDLDKFKSINDTYGHDVGDKLLTTVAQRIRQCIRSTDYAFRIGGDEFSLIILDDGQEDTCQTLNHHLKEAIREPLEIESVTMQMNISSGYAVYPCDDEQVDKLMKIADQKMYLDKARTKSLEDSLQENEKNEIGET